MKKWIPIIVLLFSVPVFAAEDPLAGAHRSLKDEAFVVETSSEDATDSLNRVSGKIDLGFAAPEDTYKSTSHYKPGPFGRSEAMDRSGAE